MLLRLDDCIERAEAHAEAVGSAVRQFAITLAHFAAVDHLTRLRNGRGRRGNCTCVSPGNHLMLHWSYAPWLGCPLQEEHPLLLNVKHGMHGLCLGMLGRTERDG